MSDARVPVDAGLLARFERAAAQITWRPVATTAVRRPVPLVRVAHLHEEEARVETVEGSGRYELTVESGPVGALIVVVEAAHRGVPNSVGQRAADRAFATGSIRAVWGRAVPPSGPGVPFDDLVALARYALA